MQYGAAITLELSSVSLKFSMVNTRKDKFNRPIKLMKFQSIEKKNLNKSKFCFKLLKLEVNIVYRKLHQ